MSKIVVSHTFPRLNAFLKGLSNPREVRLAVSRSIKRTLPSIQRAAFTEIRSRKLLKLKASEVKLRARAYSVTGASKSVEEQYGKVWITPKPESLGRFYARRVRKGVSIFGSPLFAVRLNTYGAPYLKNPDRSFLVNRGQGQVIFARIAGAKRLPLEKVYGPGMAQLFNETGAINALVRVAEERYQIEFAANVKYYVERAITKSKSTK